MIGVEVCVVVTVVLGVVTSQLMNLPLVNTSIASLSSETSALQLSEYSRAGSTELKS